MDEPRYRRALLLAAPVLLVLYLIAVAVVGAAVATARIELEMTAMMYAILPVIAFGMPIRTGHRWRRVTDAKERHELFRRIVAELVIGLALLGSWIYQVSVAPDAFFTIR